MKNYYVGRWRCQKPGWEATVLDNPPVEGRIGGSLHKLGAFDTSHVWDERTGKSLLHEDFDLNDRRREGAGL